jgi:DNA-binding beta-propeller fold protein YncE
MTVLRRRVAVAIPVTAGLCGALLLGGCGGSGHHTTSTSSAVAGKPVHTVALPAGVRGAGAVQSNGYVWVLAGTGHVATLTQLQLSNGGKAATAPVSQDATSVAQSAQGQIALGTATATTGTVELLNAAAQDPKTVPVGGPVEDVAYGPSGKELYVLDGTAKSRSITVFDLQTHKATESIGVPPTTISIVPNPSESGVWSLTRAGVVTEVGLSDRKPITSISIKSTGVALALSPTGNTLYVLKRVGANANVAVISTNTSSITKVLPAAADSVAVGVSVNSSQLYDYVGSPRYGNVQIFSLS